MKRAGCYGQDADGAYDLVVRVTSADWDPKAAESKATTSVSEEFRNHSAGAKARDVTVFDAGRHGGRPERTASVTACPIGSLSCHTRKVRPSSLSAPARRNCATTSASCSTANSSNRTTTHGLLHGRRERIGCAYRCGEPRRTPRLLRRRQPRRPRHRDPRAARLLDDIGIQVEPHPARPQQCRQPARGRPLLQTERTTVAHLAYVLSEVESEPTLGTSGR
ncbi:hypothetical protein ABTX85_15600 [Streptomyces sp. NPDC096097]|uniref:hypothetical protein n=1 Tax=Streptomyces sp. NPDC096097 TaxID=3155546 RepID=UPI00331C08C0